jgi:phospholipase D1/2
MDMTIETGKIFKPGENCCAVATAQRMAMVVDGENYFDLFARAAEGAERSILILAWDFDSRTPLRFDESGKPTLLLGDFLNDLAKRKRHLRIRILDWDYPMVFGTDREFPPTYGLTWKPHRRIEFRYDDTHPFAGSHHQKIVIIDDRIAFCGGLDLTSKRWDSRDHKAGDKRRSCGEDQCYPPFHDVMALVDGEAAQEIAKVARRRWRCATGQKLKPVTVQHDPWPQEAEPLMENVPVAVSCTFPEQEKTPEVRHVERLYLDMIAKARRYIYIENQYFTSQKIGDALGARLDEPDGPEIIVLTRQLSHGWLEDVTMHTLRIRLVKALRERDKHGKIRVLYPDVCGLDDGTCVDLHSKVMIIDDEWLRIGSANLSNRSMGLDTECDITMEARGDPTLQRAIRKARDTLLAEHLGAEREVLERELEKHGGSMAATIAVMGTKERSIRELEVHEVSEGVTNVVATVADPEKPISLDRLVGEFAPRSIAAAPRHGLAIAAAVLLVVGVLTWAWRYTALAEVVTPEAAIELAEGLAGHWWTPLLIFLAYTPASFVMFPRPLITMASVVIFGAWLGAAVSLSGILFAALVGYMLGRLLDRDTVRRYTGPRMERITHFLQRKGLIAMTIVRLVPVAPFQVVSALAGAVRVKVRDFLLGTAIGMAPGLLVATVLGDQVVEALRANGRANIWIAAGAVLVLAAIGFAGNRWLKRNKTLGAP